MDTRETITSTEDPAPRPCVLLVEDEPNLSKLVGALLETAGYEHVSISDHRQISAEIHRTHPQCVILDSDPGSKGHQRSWADAAAIRRAHPDLPVLMFTADPAAMAEARAGTTARSRAAGYAGVLDKPFLVVEFLATLKHAVDLPTGVKQDYGKGIGAEAVTVFPELGGPASSDFFSMAVHELRTPLTSISGHAQLAQRYLNTDPARAAAAMDSVREQSKRLDRLIGDILDSARMSVGALRLDVVTFDLGVAVTHTVGLLNTEDPACISLRAKSGARVRGDPDRIAQVLSNLLDNARKYSAPGAPVDVDMTIVGNEAQIRVTDRGLGVPEDEKDRLFAPFYRTSRTRSVPGTGLGLHISRRIAEQHQGRLWLDSTSDAGSVFALALPLASD